MVKLTMVARVRDGLPLAQGPRYVDQNKDNIFLFYRQQAELILQEISRGALAASEMTIRVDHHSFHYLVANGMCFITLCDSSYPRKLAFLYLQDLQKEFEKFDDSLIEKIATPYTFVKFDVVIGNTRKQYVDTRTQSNLSKLNANRQKEVAIVTQHISDILEIKRNSEREERRLANPQTVSSIWGSPLLEVIALKWTPITIVVVVAALLLCVRLNVTDNFSI